MNFLDEIRSKARKLNKRIILPEISDTRIIEAAKIIAKEEIAQVILPQESDFNGLDPLVYGAKMVSEGRADGMVAGAAHATADTLRSAIHYVGVASGNTIISSFFIMVVPNSIHGENGILFFADCAVLPDPNPKQLAEIAITTARSFTALMGKEPRVAMLSFSTKGSSVDKEVHKVREATQFAREMNPKLLIDGELQVDAALIAEIGNRKSPGSPVAGRANVLIFPDLDAGNIGYKLTERLAKAVAIGPILQGVAKPVNDLSRGCSVEDVVNVVAITAIQANLTP